MTDEFVLENYSTISNPHKTNEYAIQQKKKIKKIQVNLTCLNDICKPKRTASEV